MPSCGISNFSGQLVEHFCEKITGKGEHCKNSGPFLLKNWRFHLKDAQNLIQMIRIYGYWSSYKMLVPLGQVHSETGLFGFDLTMDTIEINVRLPPPWQEEATIWWYKRTHDVSSNCGRFDVSFVRIGHDRNLRLFKAQIYSMRGVCALLLLLKPFHWLSVAIGAYPTLLCTYLQLHNAFVLQIIYLCHEKAR